jgi:hypothetical protein
MCFLETLPDSLLMPFQISIGTFGTWDMTHLTFKGGFGTFGTSVCAATWLGTFGTLFSDGLQEVVEAGNAPPYLEYSIVNKQVRDKRTGARAILA